MWWQLIFRTRCIYGATTTCDRRAAESRIIETAHGSLATSRRVVSERCRIKILLTEAWWFLSLVSLDAERNLSMRQSDRRSAPWTETEDRFVDRKRKRSRRRRSGTAQSVGGRQRRYQAAAQEAVGGSQQFVHPRRQKTTSGSIR